MWDSDNLWPENRNLAPASSYHATTNKIHVLLVEHESECLLNTAKMLEMCQYRVTLVELASAALSMVGNATFDVVIANINSPDLHGFKLLQLAVSMGLPIAVVSNDANTYLAMRALESGAFLYVNKPLTFEILKCLWQHALREKTRMIREKIMLMGSTKTGQIGVENPNTLESMAMTISKNKEKLMKKSREGEFEVDRHAANNNVKRKMCTEWTRELHAKFMAAVEELGQGRCFPKEILEMMNVPGLTRMQVASHLQKCRNDDWRSPLERKSAQPASSDAMHKRRRFGSKPALKTSSNPTRDPRGPNQGSQTQFENVMPNNGTPDYHHQQHCGLMGPGPVTPHLTANSTNYRHSADDQFFSFEDVDCFFHNFSGLPHGSGLRHPSPAQVTYNFAPYYHELNSGGPSMESKSQWSSETSNFEST